MLVQLRRRRMVALGMSLALLLTAFGPALPQSLRQRLQRNQAKKAEVKSQLKHEKAEQATAKNRLVASQRALAAAQRKLAGAQTKLSATRGTLRQVKVEHKQTQARLVKHSGRMEQRLLALYRNDQPSYVEVLLNATDFEDFANRAEFTGRVAGQDQKVLTDLADAKRELERQAVVLQDKEIEQAKLVREVDAQKHEVAAKTEEAHSLLAKANSDVAAAEDQLRQLEQDAKDMAAMVSRVQSGPSGGHYTGHWSGSLLRPVDGRVTCPFGPRIHPITHRPSFHNGVDLGAGYGTPIHAAANGLIVHSGWWGAYGQAVIIDHGSGLSTMYGHMSSIAVGDGQTVHRGQIIGYVGSTGWSTGPHLHFTVFKNGDAVNPLGF